MTRAASDAAPVLLGALAGALVAGRLESAAACVAAAAIAAARAGARPPSAVRVRLLATGAALAVGLNLYLNPGRALPVLPELFGHPATFEGLAYGILLAMRLAGAALATAGLAAAWPGERAADELARLASPLSRIGVPVADAHAVSGLALRFAPLLGDEVRRIAGLQDLRAGRAARGWGERVLRARAVLVPALVGALERAERVALGLEARHHRIRPLPPGVRAPAWSVAGGTALFGIALLWRGR